MASFSASEISTSRQSLAHSLRALSSPGKTEGGKRKAGGCNEVFRNEATQRISDCQGRPYCAPSYVPICRSDLDGALLHTCTECMCENDGDDEPTWISKSTGPVLGN